jgi:hypothetical protein
MAQHNCADPQCGGKASGKNLFCVKSWFALPEYHRDLIRNETEKGEHTLRAHPTRDWLNKALHYLHEPRKVEIPNSEIVAD